MGFGQISQGATFGKQLSCFEMEVGKAG
jgi:hypothetical protein